MGSLGTHGADYSPLWEAPTGPAGVSEFHKKVAQVSPLLKHRSPFLCQQCHSEAGHPGMELDGSLTASGSRFVMLQGCLNCHSQVHGSNHLSGVRRER